MDELGLQIAFTREREYAIFNDKIIIILMVQLDFAIKSNYNTKLTLTDICDPIYQLK